MGRTVRRVQLVALVVTVAGAAYGYFGQRLPAIRAAEVRKTELEAAAVIEAAKKQKELEAAEAIEAAKAAAIEAAREAAKRARERAREERYEGDFPHPRAKPPPPGMPGDPEQLPWHRRSEP